MPIHFFSESIDFKLSHPRRTVNWIKRVINEEKAELDCLNFIFCSDEYLLGINSQYLDHHYYTDIITFDNSEDEGPLLGDIFISIERAKENAAQFSVTLDKEVNRLLIHGVLHLLGYNDKDATEKAEMRRKEDAYLSLLKD